VLPVFRLDVARREQPALYRSRPKSNRRFDGIRALLVAHANNPANTFDEHTSVCVTTPSHFTVQRQLSRRRALMSTALRRRSPFDAEIVRLMDVQGSVWPLSFGKQVRRQYQCRWRALSLIVDLATGHVNPRIAERRDSQLIKRNSLLNLDF
jgi:hypothetical protein